MKGKVYLIPTPISEGRAWQDVTPAYNVEIIKSLDYFVVENLRSARRFLSSLKCGIVIDETEFSELSEHTNPKDVERMLEPVLKGRSVGILSEAGVPGVADPGSELVSVAHRHDVEVIPLVGPSSILMALMASGMNGQQFSFSGYLPVKPEQRKKALRDLERLAARGISQIFIETPYRNEAMFNDICSTLSGATKMCVAVDITSPEQIIATNTIEKWKKLGVPNLRKRPTIFILG